MVDEVEMSKINWRIVFIVALLVILMIQPVLFFFFNPFDERADAMTQREMTRCFRRNYDDLSIVATYFMNLDFNHDIEIIYMNGEVTTDSSWGTDRIDFEIQEDKVIEAIIRLKNQGYVEITSRLWIDSENAKCGRVMFIRDETIVTREQAGVRAHGGTRRTGVYYIYSDSIDRTWEIPISRRHPNWYFFSWMGE